MTITVNLMLFFSMFLQFLSLLRIATTLPELLKALQIMKFDWALGCQNLQQLQGLVDDLRTKQQVNVVEDAAS